MAPGFFFSGKIHGHRSYKAWDRIAGFLRGNAHAVKRLFRAKFPRGTENLLDERVCKPTAYFFPQCQDHGPDGGEVSGLLREHEDADKPGDRQAETEYCAPPQFAHRAGWHLRGVQVRVRGLRSRRDPDVHRGLRREWKRERRLRAIREGLGGLAGVRRGRRVG